jgi:thymidylate kinase
MNDLATGKHNPDMSIVINIPARKAYDRVHFNSDRNENNKYDAKEYSFFEKIASAYEKLNSRYEWLTDHLYKRVYVDGDQDRDAACKLIVEKIKLVLEGKDISEE